MKHCDMYRKIPNEMEQTGQYTASINDFPTHMSIYTMLVWGLLMNERGYIDYEGAMVAKCGLDGEGGSKICHNFVRFADVWDKEKIGGGNLWVVRIAKYGTLIVEHVDENVFSEKEEALGKVYLVKGLGSKIGETLDSMPKLCYGLRLLPIYNVLAYDGFFRENTDVGTPSAEFVAALNAKVDEALRKQTVIFCGKSAFEGLWDEEPPKPEVPEYSGPMH